MFRRTGTSDDLPALIMELNQRFGTDVKVIGVYAKLGKVIVDAVDWRTLHKLQKQYPSIFALPLYQQCLNAQNH